MENVIELRNIVQKYKDFTAFDGLNMVVEDVPGAQFVAIMGPSGCGKSTLFRYLAGLQKPTSGEILLYGKPLTPKDTIPMVFQNPSSLEWYSVLKNVALPLLLKGVKEKEANERAMEIIKLVELEGHERKYAKYPLLSGGQLQRVAIARSLVANPNMILLDEPFSALDAKNRRKMQDFLANLSDKAVANGLDPTFILVTHDSREAAYLAKEIFIMTANPGTIAYNLKVNFPDKTDLKKKPEYIELVSQIDKIMDS